MRRFTTRWCAKTFSTSKPTSVAPTTAAAALAAAAFVNADDHTALGPVESDRMTPAAFRCVLALAARPGGAAELEAAEFSATGLASSLRVLHNPACVERPFEAAYVELCRDDAGANRRHGGVPSGTLSSSTAATTRNGFVDTRKSRIDFAALARASAAAVAAQERSEHEAAAARVEAECYNNTAVDTAAAAKTNGEYCVSTVWATSTAAGRAGFAMVAARVAAGDLPGRLRNMTGQCGFAAWECRPDEYSRVLRDLEEQRGGGSPDGDGSAAAPAAMLSDATTRAQNDSQ